MSVSSALVLYLTVPFLIGLVLGLFSKPRRCLLQLKGGVFVVLIGVIIAHFQQNSPGSFSDKLAVSGSVMAVGILMMGRAITMGIRRLIQIKAQEKGQSKTS